jgi:glycogen(starch) synthase
MKILILSNLYPPHVLGGYEILCEQVCEEYRRLGHEVVVLTTTHGMGENSGEAVSQRTPSGIQVERRLDLFMPFSQPVKGSLRQVRHRVGKSNQAITAQFLQDYRPDVVHVWSQLRLTLGPAIACHHAGLPLVFSFNDEHITGYSAPVLTWHPRSWAGWVLDRVIYPSNTLAALPMKYGTAISKITQANIQKRGISPTHFPVIYQGIPVESFPSKDQPGQLSDPLRLLYAGQLHRYKGVHTVVEAAHQVAATRAVCLTVAGAGDPNYEKELRDLAAKGPAEVRFVGRVDRAAISELYRAQDIFVFSSIWQEPFGLTHLEAMASGLPVVSTLCGGQGEFLEPGVNCLAFEAEDSAGLAQQIRLLVDQPELCQLLALAGQAVARERFSVSRYALELLDLLGRAAS